MDDTPVPPTTDEVNEFTVDRSPARKKSPPLAFAKTSNDVLIPSTASSSTMGRISPQTSGNGGLDLQVIVVQQATTIDLLHEAFASERQSWSLEKDRLYQRIASLEKLLKNADGHSPAKSPILSPFTPNITSPQSKATTSAHRLPSIAEDEAIPPLSQRRQNAPKELKLEELSVSFNADETPAGIKVEEIPSSPAAVLSPPPLINRMEAGHTPIHAPRPLTPPPKNSLTVDGIDDTPTRNNTHMNALISQMNDEDKEKELTGPLNLPELPNNPDATNFTLEALSKRLEQIKENPDESKPMVFAQPSPGLASPAEEVPEDGGSTDKSISREENPLAPTSTVQVSSMSASELSSNLSPNAALSPLSKHASRENKVQADFESGGIKLKKRPSTNFGAPFGQLGRVPSRDW